MRNLKKVLVGLAVFCLLSSTISLVVAKEKPITLRLEMKASELRAEYVREAIGEFEKLMEEKGQPIKVQFLEAPKVPPRLGPEGVVRREVFTDEDYKLCIELDMMKDKPRIDVFQVDSFWAPEFGTKGSLLSLDKYVKEWADWDQYYQVMKAAVSYEGEPYAIMSDSDVRMLYYRKDILMRAGIELPWEPKSWDDIIETAKTIKKKLPGICPLFIYAGLPPGERTTMQGFYMLLRGANGRLYDPEDEKWIAKSSALLKTLQAYWDIFVRYKLVPTDLMLYGRPHEAMEKGIQKGTLAIAISGSWCWEEVWGPEGRRPLPARDLVLGWAPMPGSGMPNAPEHVTVSGGWGWSINSKSSHPDEAFELIKILCSKEMITKLCTRISYIPPRKDVLETEAYMEQKFLTEAAKLTNITWFRPPLPEYPIITRYIQQATSRVITNECTPEEAMNLYAKEIEMILGPEKVKIEG